MPQSQPGSPLLYSDDGKRIIGYQHPDRTAFYFDQSLNPQSVVRVACLGDSRTRFNHDSALNNTQNFGYAYWAMAACGGRVNFPVDLNFGVSGETSGQVLARLSSVLSSNADACVVFCSTNDRAADLPASVSISNLDAMVSAIVAAGKKVILIAEFPRGDSTFTTRRLTTTQLQAHFQVREWCLAQQFRQNVHVVDPWQLSAVQNSTTGDVKLGLTYDGLHPSISGAKIIGESIAAKLNVVYPPFDFLCASNSDLFDATNNPRGNLIVNGMMDGTTTATGWSSLPPAGVTATMTVKTDALGLYQEIVLSGTPTTASPFYELRRDAVVTQIGAGDTTEVTGQIDVLAGGSGYYATSLGQRFTYTGFPTASKGFGDGDPAGGTMVNTAYTVKAISPRVTHPAQPTTARARFNVFLIQNQAVSVTIQLRAVALRKVF